MDFTGERVVPNQVSDDLFNEHISRYVFASKFINKHHQVLDVGCGTGYGTFELSKVAGEVTGIDISSEAIDYAKSNYAKDNLIFVCKDSRNIEKYNEFDIAVSFEVIEHIEFVEEYLSSIKKSLKPEGVFIVSTPNKKMYSDSIENYKNPYHVKEYYYDEFKALLSLTFSNVEIYSQDFTQGLIFKSAETNKKTIDVEDSKRNYDIEDASFFIAICSNASVSLSGKSLFYSFSESNILAEKDRYINALKNEIDIRDKSVFAIQESITNYEVWLKELQDQNHKYYSQIVELNRDIEILNEQNNVATTETLKRDKSIEELLNDKRKLEEWVEIATLETKKRDEIVTYLNNEIKIKKNEYFSQINELKSSIEELLKEKRNLEQWIEIAVLETSKRDESVTFLQNEISELKSQINMLQSEGNMKSGEQPK